MYYEPRGRPKKDPENTLSEKITIKVPPTKKRIFKMEARRCGVDLSDLIRGVASASARKSLASTNPETAEDPPEDEEKSSEADEKPEIPVLDYDEPVPDDFQELLSFFEQIRGEAESTEELSELEDILHTLEHRLREWLEDHRDMLKEREQVRNETEAEVKNEYGKEKCTDQIVVRVRPKERELLEEVLDGEDFAGLSTRIRNEVGLWVSTNEIGDRVSDKLELITAEKPRYFHDSSQVREVIEKITRWIETDIRKMGLYVLQSI